MLKIRIPFKNNADYLTGFVTQKKSKKNLRHYDEDFFENLNADLFYNC